MSQIWKYLGTFERQREPMRVIGGCVVEYDPREVSRYQITFKTYKVFTFDSKLGAAE